MTTRIRWIPVLGVLAATVLAIPRISQGEEDPYGLSGGRTPFTDAVTLERVPDYAVITLSVNLSMETEATAIRVMAEFHESIQQSLAGTDSVRIEPFGFDSQIKPGYSEMSSRGLKSSPNRATDFQARVTIRLKKEGENRFWENSLAISSVLATIASQREEFAQSLEGQADKADIIWSMPKYNVEDEEAVLAELRAKAVAMVKGTARLLSDEPEGASGQTRIHLSVGPLQMEDSSISSVRYRLPYAAAFTAGGD
jgi:hypothetical protein